MELYSITALYWWYTNFCPSLFFLTPAFSMLDKETLSERDICTKFITPALVKAGWEDKFLEEVSFTDGRIFVRGSLTGRGKPKRADYILYYKPGIPVAVVEAKDNKHRVGDGLQQALDYARILDIPTVFSSNGDGFVFHDRTASDESIEREIRLDEFPTPDQLWQRYKKYKGIETPDEERISEQPYYDDGSNRRPRYYQQIAVNRSVEAIAKGQNRILLVMATGTGKTYTAFQIIYRLWKSGRKKRILFLADRTALIDQTRRGDFKHFRDKMTILRKKVVNEGGGRDRLMASTKRGIDSTDKAYEIFLGLYQGLTSTEGLDAYRDFSPDFFDLIVVDECHRGSANADSAWRGILDYFSNATQIGLTATPRETTTASNSEYFAEPIYTYSLKQGIADGFLAPYRVVRVGLNVDLDGWRPDKGKRDKAGNLVEDRNYNRLDYDRSLVIDERTKTVAAKITEFLKGHDRFAKTIVFCSDIDHAERMRSELVRLNADEVRREARYVMRITGDEELGKAELDNFINPEERYPVIATTSKLMTTGVDAQTCRLIVLDSNIQSMTEFKQIIGRGTRINEDHGKLYFTILDFRHVTDLFADPAFDGDPVRVKDLGEGDSVASIEAEEEAADHSPLVDEENGEEMVIVPPEIRQPNVVSDDGHGDYTPRGKVYVNGVNVSVLVERELTFDQDGKSIVVGLKDFTRDKVRAKFGDLNDFLTRWNTADRKEALVDELREQGVLLDEFLEAVDRDADLFDLIVHVAFDQKPLTRRERAEQVKKRNYFTKFGEPARRVLDALLDKYADEGIQNLETLDVLRVKPLDSLGSPMEIVRLFGDKTRYLQAVRELEEEIYRVTA